MDSQLVFLLVFVVFIVLLYLQIKQYREGKKWQKELKALLPFPADYSRDEHGLIRSEAANEDLLYQINAYLDAHKHVAVNFAIVKDCVERKSGELHAFIRSQLSLPLYYGLCGTLLGIAIGQFLLGGRESYYDNESLDWIMFFSLLMSLAGVFLTSKSRSHYKAVIVQHEQAKNRFYDWFQLAILPVMGNDLTGEMGKLVKSFAKTAAGMQQTAESITDTFNTQRELMRLFKRLSDGSFIEQNMKVAEHNHELLGQITQHIDVLHSFTERVGAMQGYVQTLQSITTQLTSSTDYLGVVTKLTTLLNDGTESIARVVEGQKYLLSETFNSQEKLVDTSMSQIATQNEYVVQRFVQHLSDTSQTIEKYLSDYSKEINKLKEFSSVPESLSQLPSAISALNEGLCNVTKQLEEIKSNLDAPKNDNAKHSLEQTPKPAPTAVEKPLLQRLADALFIDQASQESPVETAPASSDDQAPQESSVETASATAPSKSYYFDVPLPALKLGHLHSEVWGYFVISEDGSFDLIPDLSDKQKDILLTYQANTPIFVVEGVGDKIRVESKGQLNINQADMKWVLKTPLRLKKFE